MQHFQDSLNVERKNSIVVMVNVLRCEENVTGTMTVKTGETKLNVLEGQSQLSSAAMEKL